MGAFDGTTIVALPSVTVLYTLQGGEHFDLINSFENGTREKTMAWDPDSGWK